MTDSILQVDKIIDKAGTTNKELAQYSSSAWSWGQGVPKGSVIEQFASPCDGSAITVQSGTYNIQNIVAEQPLTTSYANLGGSVITYTPPTGTQTVIYDFDFAIRWNDADLMYMHKLSIGGTEVTNARQMYSFQGGSYLEKRNHFKWAFHIGGSQSDGTGRQATWTSGKEIKLEIREHTTSQEGTVHQTYHWDGSATNQFSQPVIGITALA